MSKEKKLVRISFRTKVFDRDKWRCRVCGFTVKGNVDSALDAHHITDRSEMPNGGYVVENGITLCKPCHRKAEDRAPSYSPDTLYDLIGSSYKIAYFAAERSR